MSGIEIVGVVLGVLPLIVQGLQKYSEGVSTTKRLLHPDRELRRLRLRVNAELQIFRNTARLLLVNITTEADVVALINNPNASIWNEGELENKLKTTLDSSYKIWREVMENMHEAVDELQSRLGLSLTVPAYLIYPRNKLLLTMDQPSSTQEGMSAMQSLKIGFGKTVFEELIIRIKDHNEVFARLTAQSLSLALHRIPARRRVPDYSKIRADAKQVFATLDIGLRCPCRLEHILYLALKTTKSAEQAASATLSCQCHRVILASSSLLAGTPHLLADVELTVAERDCKLVTSQVLGLAEAVGTSQQVQAMECLTFLRTSDNTASRTMTGRLPTTECPAIVSFDTVQATPGQKLRGCARRQIALVVASSVLQLYSTPWLQQRLQRNEIHILRASSGASVDLAFISRSIQVSRSSESDARFTVQMDLAGVRNEWLYSLGIFLIELCLGQSMADLQKPEDKVPGGLLECVTEFRAARRLISTVAEEAGTQYGDVVRRCIWCDFDQREYDLDKEGFCKAVYRGVVAPLEDDVRRIDGKGHTDVM
ncbi:hypothetical protein LTR15_004210 [Elasticomyces elasticus]|nr:hypothetical protein LTR15_004210 [Elasticomyces elasticus]